MLGVCVPCTATTPCGVGEYRLACTTFGDGICAPCTNAIPGNASYSTSGIPFFENQCGFACDAGFYQDTVVSVVVVTNGSETSNQSVCRPCANAIPDKAVYSGPSDTLG
eukprot:188937-Rhodomonas_salina.1